MIRGARTVHRWIWIALAILLPALLGAALAVRPQWPVERQLPDSVPTFADEVDR